MTKETDKPARFSDDHWKEQLDPQTYMITRQHGTEAPFSHPYNDNKQEGAYRCVCCQTPLFDSEHKYDSGSGWPSFYQPTDGVKTQLLKHKDDYTKGYLRLELLCAHCDAHLGHVFDDGPQEKTGKRYCINGTALIFKDRKDGQDE